MVFKASEQEKEKIKLTVREILLNLLDISVTGLDIFDGYHLYRKEIQNYRNWRELEKENFSKACWRLEKQGYIKHYQANKKFSLVFKLTTKGKKRAFKYLTNELKINIPKNWDRKWRIVIFDVPKDKKQLRDIIRAVLKRLGFFQLQKSVFVYPFDCREAIAALKYFYNCSGYLQYIIAEEVENEIDLVNLFYDQGILEHIPLDNI